MKTLALLTLAVVPSLALNIPTQQRLFPENELSGNHYNPQSTPSTRETCPQPPQAFRARQAKRLSRAVQIPTTVGDYMKDPYDQAFEPVVKFQSLLEEMFPLVHDRAKVEHVNRLGLVFTFEGADTSLKPLLFMAHQDVVPIDDASDWTHPPFAGVFDGEWIWGRGSSDCKNVLIGLMSAVEDLLSQGWQPRRTVLFAFGFDEESHGFLGAGAISAALEEKYGKDSFEFILDEAEWDSRVWKGSLDLIIDIAVPGGHSSIPPAHTGIGIMAEILYELERKELFPAWLDTTHPAHGMLECQARYSPEHVETWLSDKLAADDPAALGEAVASSRGPAVRYTIQTSQAADLIHGGVKTNALPEKISAVVNYRVALHQTPDELRERAIRLISPIAESHNLTLRVDFPGVAESTEGDVSDRTLTLSPLSVPLSPAPISPTDPLTSKVWAHFAGVARSVFESHSNPLSESASGSKPTVVVTGDVMTGNTDTRFYWSLSENIYRWSPSRAGGSLNIHTVDERIRLDVHLEGMMLYYDLIRSFDAWDGK
ncbi:hypothetical protein N7530_007021 [Penicillium desertorum]|uniref:Peptidase M20 dimerisation domain-containing protein n=1 Tax=Penicillium desertorum TaxID=1303715 RepID=A0A9W9WST0_9EURO|nr:hypothetical protein N7530_007021 [Penicillium desertorum]